MSIDVADLTARLGLESLAFDAAMTVAEGHARSGAARMKLALAGITVGAVVGLGELVKHAADFEATTQQLANNTNLGAKGLTEMRIQSMQIAQLTGQPLEDIANGYMHIANHAYSGAAAMNIAMAAAKNAAATGGSASDDMNVLAGVMREYGVSARAAAADSGLATRYLDVMHNAVANSNYTMKQFAEGAKMAFATAGSYKVPLAQVTAQLAILSEHGFPGVQRASTNWAGMLGALERPTNKALAGMRELSQRTGVHLIADIAKLRQNGAFLPQFLSDIGKATGGDPNKLAMVMTQTNTYGRALRALVLNQVELERVTRLTTAAQAGTKIPGLTGTNEAFEAWRRTTSGQIQILRGNFSVLAVELGSIFLPMVNRTLVAIEPVVNRFTTWVGQQHNLGGALASAVNTLQGVFNRMLVWVRAEMPILAAAILRWGEALVNWVKPRIQPMLTELIALGSRLITWLRGELPQIKAIVVGWAAEIATVGTKAWRGAQPTLRTLGMQIVTWMETATTQITQNTTKWADAFAEWLVPVKAKTPGNMDSFIDVVTTWVNSRGVTAMTNLAIVLGNAFADALAAAIKNAIRNAFTFGWNAANAIPGIQGLDKIENQINLAGRINGLLGAGGPIRPLGTPTPLGRNPFAGLTPIVPHTRLEVAGIPASAGHPGGGTFGRGPTTITVHVTPSNVRVAGADPHGLGDHIGKAVQAAIDAFDRAERATLPPPPRQQAGARAS